MRNPLVPGDLVATTRPLAHGPERRDPARPDGPPLPAGAQGMVCRHLAAGYLLVDFEHWGTKAVPASALALMEAAEEECLTWTGELLDLVVKQAVELRRLKTALDDLHSAAPPRLAPLPRPVEVETVTLPGSTLALAQEMQREGWITAETREDGAITWCRLRK